MSAVHLFGVRADCWLQFAKPGCAAQQVVYELRIYSMEPGSFGSVVRSRQVKAPHCITSIQFSPTSEHLLIAYGRCDVLESVTRSHRRWGPCSFYRFDRALVT